jgi:hypothetical protein
LRTCPYCGGKVERKSDRGPAPSYCSPACRLSQNNSDLSDGGAIIKLAKAWREARGSGPVGAAAFRQMTAALDTMLEANRKSGRPSALYAAAALLQQGTTYQDRRRA